MSAVIEGVDDVASVMESDQNLLKRIRERDAAAFEMLLARYRDAVYRHLARTVRDEDAADDLVQEVFLRVWTRADQWDGHGPFKAWLFRIATNLALNLLRSVRRRREQPLDVPPELGGDESDLPAPSWMIDESALGPEAALERAERRDLVRRLVDQLPEEKREVIRMIHEAQMDIAETAQALSIPEGTVKSRLHHAKKHLARELKGISTEWEEI